MPETSARIQRAIEEIAGKEAVLEMRDRRIATARSIVSRTGDLDDRTMNSHQPVARFIQLIEQPQ
jgi:hypothetical protein